MNIINPYRFGGTVPAPLHWWDLDTNTASSAGINDQGTGAWGYLSSSRYPALASSGAPDGGDCCDFNRGAATAENDYLIEANKTWDGGQDNLTVSCWVYHDSISGGASYCVDWEESATERLFDFAVLNAATDHFYTSVFDSSETNLIARDTSLLFPTATWKHCVMTYDGTTCRQYINGTETASETTPSLGAFETLAMDFSIGCYARNVTNYQLSHDGRLWACGIWDVALDQGQIDHLYNNGNGRKYADLNIV